MEAKKREEDDRKRKERDEEEKLDRRLKEQQDRMKKEYDEEANKKKAKEEAVSGIRHLSFPLLASSPPPCFRSCGDRRS